MVSSDTVPTVSYLPGCKGCGDEYAEAESPAPGTLYLGFYVTEAGLVLLYLVYVIWT